MRPNPKNIRKPKKTFGSHIISCSSEVVSSNCLLASYSSSAAEETWRDKTGCPGEIGMDELGWPTCVDFTRVGLFVFKTDDL